MENCIPEFWEREWEWKIAFPTFGNGNGNEKLIPKLWEREWEAGIPGNGREREFPLTPGTGTFQDALDPNVIHTEIDCSFCTSGKIIGNQKFDIRR